MTRLVLHVGYGKTATTTLQTHLFANHSQLRYLGRPYPDPLWEAAMRRLIFEDSALYDPAPLRAMVEEERLRGSGVVLLSEEILLSPRARDTGLIALRLRDAFEPCEIILSIRSQPSIIASYYAMHGRRLALIPGPLAGRSVTFADWFAFQQSHLPTSYLSLIHYAEVVGLFARTFGRDHLYIALFEEFVQDTRGFIDKLCGFLGIDPGEGMRLLRGQHEKAALSDGQIRMQLLRSRFLPGLSLTRIIPFGRPLYDAMWRALSRSGRYTVEFSPEQNAFIQKLYAEGNRRLAVDFSLPLDHYGYPF